MSIREMAYNLIDSMTDKQIEGFIMMFGQSICIPEEEPDELDKALIKDSMIDNDETMLLDDFVEMLGIDKNEL